jgi:hypothetical protein
MRRRLLWTLAVVGLVFITYYAFGQQSMLTIKFDLGKNIVETAKASGVPKYSVGNTDGLIDYSINQLAPEVHVQYIRPGYEISVAPLFAFTMYADEERNDNLAVNDVTLQVFQQVFRSHEAARAFVQNILEQFKAGKWHRYISEFCPAVSGRSSLLDEKGALAEVGECSPDPDYRLTDEEWLVLMDRSADYQWIGDGIIAQLSVRYSNDSRGITYSIFLEFENYAHQQQRNAKALADDIEDGERRGWNTAAQVAAERTKIAAEIKLLEENALKRGDSIVPRYDN